MKSINEPFAANHADRFRYDEDPHLEPINSEVLAGWVSCSVILVACWALIAWLVRWAWIHWEVVKGFFGL